MRSNKRYKERKVAVMLILVNFIFVKTQKQNRLQIKLRNTCKVLGF